MISASLLPAPTRAVFPSKSWLDQKALGSPMEMAAKRGENRTALKVAVDLSSLDLRTPAQEGVTENISARGARVLTNRPWKPNESLHVRSLLGNFKSRARVVYCVPVDGELYAIGLQLFAAAGNWKSPH
jgi:hypothetical protein